MHDAYKKVRLLRRGSACRAPERAARNAGRKSLTPHCCGTQAKNKSTQLQEAITAAVNDRDELQKKYEAKSRYAQRRTRQRC